MKAKLVKTVDGYELFTQGFLKGSANHGLIESLNIEEGPIRYKLSLKNCQAIERGYDLDELAREITDKEHLLATQYSKGFEKGIIVGFQKALEILGDKKFSYEDMEKVFVLGVNSKTELHARDKAIQSIQQTEWDVEIEIKNVIDETRIVGAIKGVKGSGNKITTYKQIPKLDADGCLILKRT